MISRLQESSTGVTVVQDGLDDSEKVSYCPNCLKYANKQRRLVPLIILEGMVPPADYDNWKQCPFCFVKVEIYKVRYESSLSTDIEGVENPFDFNTAKNITGVGKTGIDNRMKQVQKKIKSKSEDYSKDKEIMNEVKDGAVIFGYVKQE